MNSYENKAQEDKTKAAAHSLLKKQTDAKATSQFADNRPEAIAQRQLKDMADNSQQVQQLRSYQQMADNSARIQPSDTVQAASNNFTVQTKQRKEFLEKDSHQGEPEPIQRKENKTGLPDNLKSGVENLSGMDMGNVKVHYNSSQPAQLNALAYAQGNNIHIAPGEEKHLPHEAWHVVQQRQGRVQATKQLKQNIHINDDPGLEREADTMGAKAFNHTGGTDKPLQRKSTANPVIQRVNAEGVTTFFRDLKAAQPNRLNLYTHVMADGIGDASLIGHLHEKITSEMANYGIANVDTYLAVEKLVTDDELDVYVEEHEDEDVNTFSLHNPFIDQPAYAGYKALVADLSNANAGNIVWSVALNANHPRKGDGRTASNIDDNNWEIQYPVPASNVAQDHKLKIKEMGVNAIAALAKTGEIGEGIGYGIPALTPDINADEQAVIDQAAAHCNLAHAWLASIKGSGGVNPLPRVIIAARRDGGNNTLIYLPGGIGTGLATTPDYTVNAPIIAQGGLVLRNIDITTGGNVYAITGIFRNEFIHHCMGSITNGVILSGGEGLYTESLATHENNVAPIMAPRYDYQLEEVAQAIATNQGGLATVQVVRYGNQDVAASDIFVNYGVITIDGVAYTYNQDNQRLKSVYGPNFKTVHANAPVNLQPDGHIMVGYSQQLSSLYFPMSLNSNAFSHIPAQYSFQIAKNTYAAERTRLRNDQNWFNIVSEVGQEQAAQMNNAPAQQPQAANAGGSACPCCYITTACTLTRGLPDDCEELTVLRQLRDEYILKRPEGKRLVQLYYDFAPSIVLAINNREDYYEFYKKLYKIIRKCVDLTLNNELEAAYAIYCYMVHHLKEAFLPDLEIDLMK